jgi:molecular chaperone DnaJ
MKDYYKILEVEEKASADEIKKSYRTLSKKYHPDINPDGAEQFKDIAEAYDVLSNPEKKTKYDNSKSNPFQGGNYEDMLSQMFGGMNGRFRQQKRKNAPDKIIKVQVSPVDSYLGVNKELNYVKNNHCQVCNGSGGEQQVCVTCRGQGFEVKTFGTGFMVQQVRSACTTCGGRGYTLIHKCYGCGGQGINSITNNITITLPKGVDSGQFLKVENAGDFKNGEYGDLIIQVEIVNKDGYEKINNDLVYNLFLNLDEIQKNKYVIPHPDGDLSMDAPRTFDSSRPLRLRGKGYKGGDMYVKLNVKFERPI